MDSYTYKYTFPANNYTRSQALQFVTRLGQIGFTISNVDNAIDVVVTKRVPLATDAEKVLPYQASKGVTITIVSTPMAPSKLLGFIPSMGAQEATPSGITRPMVPVMSS